MPSRRSFTLAAAAFMAVPTAGRAQAPPADALIAALARGGYVVVMRHAHAPPESPPAAAADPANAGRERQLDAAGRKAAMDLGQALRALRIPLGQVWSSPTFRARQTAALAGLAGPSLSDALGDGGTSMQAVTSAPSIAFLTMQAVTVPTAGTDTLVITQQPNMAAAFGDMAAGLGDGEALVFKPDGRPQPNLAGRIAPADWQAAAQRARTP